MGKVFIHTVERKGSGRRVGWVGNAEGRKEDETGRR